MWKYVFNNVEMYIWLWKYTFLFMSGYGRDESAPTPNGVFAPHFVGVCWVFCRMFATHSQSVQNAFTEYLQRVRYLCVTYSLCKSMVFAPEKYGFWRAKRGFLHCKSMVFVFWMLCCCNLFRMLSQSVSSILAIRQQHYRNPSAAVGSDLSCPHIRIRHPFCVCLVDIKSVLWQLCPLAKRVRLRWLCSVCLLVCRLFGYCWVQIPPYFCYCRNAHRALWQHQRLCRAAQ